MSMTMVRRSAGRYEDRGSAIDPGNLPREGKRGKINVIHAKVDNPTEYGRRHLELQKVAINRETDALENEYAAGRISADGYRVGRTYQEIMRRGTSPSGTGQWLQGDRVDAARAKEAQIIAHLDSARAKVRLMEQVRSVIGWQGELLMRVVLVDGRTFGEGAEIVYRMINDKRNASHCAWQFRKDCEYLADKCPWLTQESFA
jgi:hypothetical protein